MMKKYLALTLLLSVAGAAGATPLTPDAALARLGGASAGKHSPSRMEARPAMTLSTATGEPGVYAFNRIDGNGYIIVSADDMATPLLGYCDSGSFDAAAMPEGLRWYLEEYARQIEWARANATASETSGADALLRRSREGRESVEPLVSARWDQGEPYYSACPVANGEQTYTGCVATAMAQVMHTYRYPERGEGSISYTCLNLNKKLSLDFSKQAFDWDNMLDVYKPGEYSEEQGDAVAYLMKAAGYAVKMNYSSTGSGALSLIIGEALVKYFNYAPAITYDMRSFHSAAEWEQMIYDNLKKGMPVIYGGSSALGGGHSFVCDGYSEDGYFHFNWGWSGLSNGYFLLDALNPSSLGAGGGTGGGYNFTQDAVFGIRPATGDDVAESTPLLSQCGSLEGSLEDSVLSLTLVGEGNPMWVNYTPSTLKFNFGFWFLYQDEEGAEPFYVAVEEKTRSLMAGNGLTVKLNPSLDLSSLNLKDGVYKVGTGAEIGKNGWSQCRPTYGSSAYITLTVSDGVYSIQNHPQPAISLVDAHFDGALYHGCDARFSVELENTSDVELSAGVCPVLVGESGIAYVGTSVFVTLQPGERRIEYWATSLTDMQQSLFPPFEAADYSLGIYNENTDMLYSTGQTVTMNPNPGSPEVRVSKSLSVPDAESSPISIGMVKGILYDVYDATKFDVECEVSLVSGYFSYPVVIAFCEMTNNVTGEVAVLTTAEQSVYMTEPDETASVHVTIEYPTAEIGKTYYLLPLYSGTLGLSQVDGGLGTCVRFATSGVDSVGEDSGLELRYTAQEGIVARSSAGISSVKVFTLSGQLLSTTGELPAAGGTYIIVASDNDGATRSLKIVK